MSPTSGQQDAFSRIADELGDLSAVMYGDSKRTIQGVLPAIQELRIEMIKLRSAVQYLRLVTAMLFVMMFFTLLSVVYLVQVAR